MMRQEPRLRILFSVTAACRMMQMSLSALIQNICVRWKEKKPAVTVSYGGKTLTEGKSYSCVYADNIDAGTATVTIKGENTMHGQIVEEFTIDKAKQKAPTGLVATAETVDGKMMVRYLI